MSGKLLIFPTVLWMSIKSKSHFKKSFRNTVNKCLFQLAHIFEVCKKWVCLSFGQQGFHLWAFHDLCLHVWNVAICGVWTQWGGTLHQDAQDDTNQSWNAQISGQQQVKVVGGLLKQFDRHFLFLHIVWKLLKMSNFNFWILAFSTIFFPNETDLSGNTV